MKILTNGKSLQKAIFSLLFLSSFASSSSSSSSSSSLSEIFHDFWHWRTQDSPQFATQVGLNDNTAGRLDSFSKERFEIRLHQCKNMLNRASGINTENLSFEERINLKIFKDQIQNYVDNFKYLKFFFPISSQDGVHLQLQNLVNEQMILNSYNDFQKLLSRYGEFPRQIDEVLGIMKENVATDIMPHEISMDGILNQFFFSNNSLVENTFLRPFLQIPSTVPPDQRRTLRHQAQERISQDLIPSFQKLKKFLEDTYLPKTRKALGVNSLAGGDEYYRAALQFYTSTKLSPEEIHEIGKKEIERNKREIREAIEKSETPSRNEENVLKEWRSREFLTSQTQLIDRLRSTIFQDILPKDKYFQELPLNNLTISDSEMDTWRGSPIWYRSPSRDGSRTGTLYVGKQGHRSVSVEEILTQSLQYAYPGHHLHAIYLQKSISMPLFRKCIDTPHPSLIPAEFSYYPAFINGWALYSVSLGENLGLFNSTSKKLAKLMVESTFASYLVVDTGIHKLGWSKEEAVNYMKQNTGLSPSAVDFALKKIVTLPGQACAAKIGELKLIELHKRAKHALGTSFDIKEFYHTLFQCTASLSIVEECIKHFITSKIGIVDPSINTQDKTDYQGGKGTIEDARSEGEEDLTSSSCSNNNFILNFTNTYVNLNVYLVFIFILLRRIQLQLTGI